MLNKVTLIGNVGSDPTPITTTQNAIEVTNFRFATTEKRKGADGSAVEYTEWHQVAVFGRLARMVTDHVTKGKLLYIEGRISTEKWVDKDDNQRYTTKIIVSGYNSKIIFMPGGLNQSDYEAKPNYSANVVIPDPVGF